MKTVSAEQQYFYSRC